MILFIAGVDESVKPFGGVIADGQHADVVDDDEIDASDPFDRFGDGVVGAVAADEGAEIVDAEPGRRAPGVDR